MALFNCFKLMKKSNKGMGGGKAFDGVVPIAKDMQLIDWTRRSQRPLEYKLEEILGPVSKFDKQEGTAYLRLFCLDEEDRPYFVSKAALQNELVEIPFPPPPPPLPQLSPTSEAQLNKQMFEMPNLPPPPPPPGLSPSTESTDQIDRQTTRNQRRRHQPSVAK